ncbi:MAG: T9SS type A sorting domain-containing protein [Flavobacteriales bacterium]|nr:T9SS type A sorting domain-containing protein [Flavobacteriales bacterium]MCB9447698.1 T9SS type A sorting domain-containing protein [Flavobacteriales bacterium]
MKHVVCVVMMLACMLPTQAQEFLPAPQTQPELPPVGRYQAAFQKWAEGKDLSQTKGWKWYRRWLDYQERNANPDGTFGDENIGLMEAARISEWKAALTASRKNLGIPNWMPVGPEQFPGNGMGRINCVTFHPTDPNTLWIGVAQGGVWKTTNNGQSRTPLTDDLPIMRISDIAVDPNNDQTLYLSVGDYEYLGVALNTDDRRRHTHYGIGVYKTTDGGQTWQPTGLTTQVTQLDLSLTRRVFVSSDSSDVVVAAGTYGVMRSNDGGTTWTKQLNEWMWDIEQDPVQPNTLFACSGYVSKLNTGKTGVYKSTDFGLTWTLLNTGITATGGAERMEIAVSPADHNRVYASACDASGALYGFYRSDNGGTTWSKLSGTPNLFTWGSSGSGGQGWYDQVLMADPTNKDKVYCGGVYVWGSSDGGSSWDAVGASFHVDEHQLKNNPVSGKTYLCGDGGISWTDNLKIGTWSPQSFPTQWNNISSGFIITSFYRLGLSKNNPGYIIGGAQDNSTYYFNTNSWVNIFGGDGMEAMIHPDNPGTIYGSSQNGSIRRSYNGGQTSSGITGSVSETGEWTTPYLMDANDPKILYAAFGNVWKSANEGTNWSKISSFPSAPGFSGPTPASALGVCNNDPKYMYVANRVYFSSGAMGKVRMTSNGGSSWTDVTAGLPDSLYCTYMEADDSVGTTAWATFGGYVAGMKVYKTTDGGQNWNNISMNLPNLPANCVEEDEASLYHDIYVGMDVGVFHLNDTMTQWELFSDGLPNVIISELEIHQGERKLYAATFGRGFWKTDLPPLIDPTGQPDAGVFEQMTAHILPTINKGSFQLEVLCGESHDLQVMIVDISGKTIHQDALKLKKGRSLHAFDLSLAPGMYFLTLTSGHQNRAIRFVVE